ncbi:DNA polymerase I [Chishuiella changwenlii]|uniref:DNA polymerase I n=1 Tax=Chishuiella changwenlii TaxID=1434701 RepID=A0A1M6U338_9FLAO|nr:DNA polymerase I [Chishuiella changwenlii]GGF08820.1 DNA polymerase I [Chishuiella changwenlii]SHK63617.1 DNA polymerase I [Chishuiella changwenlii]
MNQSEDKRLFLLDAYALIFRGYYAFIKNPRINSKGFNTSAIMGFANSLFDVIRREQPTHLAVVFDVGQATVRTVDYAEYKANRDETPEAIRSGVPFIQDILRALKIPVLFAEGYEADDVIGTLAKKAEKEGYTTYMVTPDKDFAQLVTDKIKMYRPAANGKGVEIWGIEEVKEKFEIDDPIQVIDYLGMMGDAVDNIPGLPGVGAKTASKYIKEFGSLEALLENTDKLKGKAKEKIEQNKELGILSKKLATIITDAPVDFDEEDLTVCPPDIEKVTELFTELEFRRMLETVYKIYGLDASGIIKEAQEEISAASQTSTSPTAQQSLFDFTSDEDIVPQNSIFTDISSTNHFYQLIDSDKGRSLLLKNILNQKEVTFDTETTSLDALEAELVGISFSWEKGKGYYIPFPTDFEETKKIIQEFSPFFEDETISKIGQNLKYDIKVLAKYDIILKGNNFDTMIAHYLINPDMRHNMDVLSETYLQYQPISIESLIGKKGKNQKNFRDVPLAEQTEYGVEDSDITHQLKNLFEPELISANTHKLFTDLEMPLMQVLADMEIEGVNLDIPFLKELSVKHEAKLRELETKIHQDAGEEFNLNSPKQLGDILFDKLQLDPKAKKTKTGQYATGEEILSKLRDKHVIINDILEYRQLQKLKSTYIDALPSLVNKKTNRLHTTYAQTVAATGRLSSVNPNLQNIPIRSEAGQQIRKAFVARDENHVLISADYSQIELRLIAQMSQDPAMVEAFTKGEDIHAATAAKVFNVALEDVTREQRSQAKTVNFGIIYGVSAFGLADQANISRKEAKILIDAYYETYPTLKAYIEKQVDIARDKGFVETLMGRRRYLKDINSRNAVVRSHAERNAVNAPIQGTAADIVKIAMIQIQKELKKNYQTKMILQVHDELIFDAPKDEVEKVSELIKTTMEAAMQMEVPLIAEVGVGNNWYEAH